MSVNGLFISELEFDVLPTDIQDIYGRLCKVSPDKVANFSLDSVMTNPVSGIQVSCKCGDIRREIVRCISTDSENRVSLWYAFINMKAPDVLLLSVVQTSSPFPYFFLLLTKLCSARRGEI
jgi:hypothetical protein